MDFNDKLNEIENNENLDVYVHDKNWHVRFAVSQQGYGLDRLVDA